MNAVTNALNPVFNSIKEFNNDVAIVFTNKDTDSQAKNLRINSLALRAFGFLATCYAACVILAGVGLVLSSPVAAVFCGVMSLSTAVLIQDCYQSAANIKNILAALPESGLPGESFTHKVCRTAAGLWKIGDGINYEASTGLPYYVRDTICFAPLIQMNGSPAIHAQ